MVLIHDGKGHAQYGGKNYIQESIQNTVKRTEYSQSIMNHVILLLQSSFFFLLSSVVILLKSLVIFE